MSRPLANLTPSKLPMSKLCWIPSGIDSSVEVISTKIAKIFSEIDSVDAFERTWLESTERKQNRRPITRARLAHITKPLLNLISSVLATGFRYSFNAGSSPNKNWFSPPSRKIKTVASWSVTQLNNMMAMDEFNTSPTGYNLANIVISKLFPTLGALISVSKSSFLVK